MTRISDLQSRRLDNIADRVRRLGLNEAELVARVAGLTGQPLRLYSFLRASKEPVDTATVRTRCSIGNVSAVAIELNRRLADAGDTQAVRCELRPHENQFGEINSLGFWTIADRERTRECA